MVSIVIPIYNEEEIFHLLTVLLIKELALGWRSFLLPDLDGLRDVVRQPDPKCTTVLASRDMEVTDRRNLSRFRVFGASLVFANGDKPFDRMAVLLRAPTPYRPLLEEALRRAGVPAWFARGALQPDPAGRAFLSLLACAAEGFSARRFAEYLSLGEVPLATPEGTPPAAPPSDCISTT